MLQSFLEEDYNQSLTRMAAPVSFESIICMSTTLTILDNGAIHSPVHVSSCISQEGWFITLCRGYGGI